MRKQVVKPEVQQLDLHQRLKFLDSSPPAPIPSAWGEAEPGKTNIESEISFVSESPPGMEKTIPTLAGEKQPFNPCKIPPDFGDAEVHASKFDEEGEDLSDYCPCCNYPHTGTEFPLFCDTKDLAELGEGFPLYYSLLKWVAFLLALCFAFAGSYCIYRNYSVGEVEDEALKTNWIVRGSLADYGKHRSPTIVEPCLHVGAIVFVLVLHNFITIRHEKLESELDRNAITPSDYTIIVSGIPTESFSKDDLRTFFETHSRLDEKQCKVSKINLVFSIADYVKELQLLSRLKERLAEIRLLHSQSLDATRTVYCCFKGPDEHAEEYEVMIREQKRKLQEMESTVQQRFTGICFIIFREDEDAKSAKRVLGRRKAMKGCRSFVQSCCPCISSVSRRRYKGAALTVRRAPDPSDLLWENLGTTRWRVVGRRLVTAAATIFVLCIGATVVYFSSNVKVTSTQRIISNTYKDIRDPNFAQIVGFNILSFLPAIIVVIMNLVLTATIWKFERLSLYNTTSDLQASVTRNLTFAMFINTALIAIPIHLGEWYGSNGLVTEIYNIMISNAVVAPILYILSPKGIIKWVRKQLAVRKGGNCMLTQLEANTLFEGLPVIMPNLCAGAMKTYLLSMMYAPVLPLGLVIGFLAIVLQYWVNKYMLLRRHSRPVRLSDELDEVMLRFIPVGCAAYAGANFYFFWELEDTAFWPGVVGCGIVLLYFLTPIQSVLKVCMRRHINDQAIQALSETPKTYEESAVDFFTDYDRANPATSAEGKAWWVEQIARKKGADAAQIAAQSTQSASVKNYAKALVPKVKRQKESEVTGIATEENQGKRESSPGKQVRWATRPGLLRKTNAMPGP